MGVDLSIAITDGDPIKFVTDLSDDVEGIGREDTPYGFLHHKSIKLLKETARLSNRK
jgi:hypothetical protein